MGVDDAARYDLIDDVTEVLEAAGVPSPDVDARLLVDHVAERFGGDLIRCDRRVLDGLVERRTRREPLQLVLGKTWFRHLELACQPGVFIPRPETEVVAGIAIDAARAAGDTPLVIEPCTGTGAVALAIYTEVPGAQVVASDRSPDAVACARNNQAAVEAMGTDGAWTSGDGPAPGATLTVVEGNLLDAVDQDLRGRVDVLVANPPYLPAGDAGSWEPEVAEHDPFDALVGGPDGYEVVDDLLALAAEWLAPGGVVVIEIDDRRGDDARDRAEQAGLVDVRVVPDYTQRDRALVARRRHP